jgi:hypothetical protein
MFLLNLLSELYHSFKTCFYSINSFFFKQVLDYKFYFVFRLTNKLPAGRSFVCLDLKNIPQILQQIFAASVLNTR